MATGKFITFEGGEGSGKSTQARLLADRLKGRGVARSSRASPAARRSPSGCGRCCSIPPAPSHSPLSEALLFYAARADHLDKTIRPTLAAGSWVICDRFSDSTRVYQGVAGGLGGEASGCAGAAGGGADVSAAHLHPRPGARGRPGAGARPRRRTRRRRRPMPIRSSAATRGSTSGCAPGYLAIAAAEPQRCVLVDGAKAPDAIAAEIWAHVERRLLQGAP